jgi:diguanylate cyclase (GGDEF)-like protein
MEKVTVADLMERSVVSVTAETRLAEVIHLMREYKVSCLLVIEESRPVGIVTESDLVRVLGRLIDGQCTKMSPVQDFMTTSPAVVQQTTPIFDALVLAKSRNIRHLPVVDDKGVLRGMLSYSDLAKGFERIVEQQRKIIEKELGSETKKLREANDQLKSLSMEDALLRIGNRRSMEVDLSYTHSLAVRYKRSYALVLYSADFFKQYNDQYGRQAGDDALKIITEHIRYEIRHADRIYRYGDEELLLLLPETELTGATITAERIVHNLAERNIPHAQSPIGILTISAGAAALENVEDEKDWHAVVELARVRLHQAKINGGNQVGSDAGERTISNSG